LSVACSLRAFVASVFLKAIFTLMFLGSVDIKLPHYLI